MGCGGHSQGRPWSWWCNQMEIFSALLALCEGNSRVTGELPSKRPVTRNFDDFFDLCLNKRLNKQSRPRSFQTPSHPLWSHCNVGQAGGNSISYHSNIGLSGPLYKQISISFPDVAILPDFQSFGQYRLVLNHKPPIQVVSGGGVVYGLSINQSVNESDYQSINQSMNEHTYCITDRLNQSLVFIVNENVFSSHMHSAQ